MDYETSKLRFFKLNAKEGKVFENIKEWENYKDVKVKWVIGKFKKIYIKETEWEWKKKESLHIVLDWWDADYNVKCTLDSKFWRSLLNSLAWEVKTKKLQNVSLSIWTKVWDNGKESHYLNVYNNDNKATWLYTIDEQKAMTEVITNKAWEYVSTDYSQLNASLRNEIDTINWDNIDISNDEVFGNESSNTDDLADLPF